MSFWQEQDLVESDMQHAYVCKSRAAFDITTDAVSYKTHFSVYIKAVLSFIGACDLFGILNFLL